MVIYKVERWDAYEIVTKPWEGICTRDTLRINLKQKTVTRLRTTKDTKGNCAGQQEEDMRRSLEDGFKVWWELNKKRVKEVRRILRIELDKKEP